MLLIRLSERDFKNWGRQTQCSASPERKAGEQRWPTHHYFFYFNLKYECNHSTMIISSMTILCDHTLSYFPRVKRNCSTLHQHSFFVPVRRPVCDGGSLTGAGVSGLEIRGWILRGYWCRLARPFLVWGMCITLRLRRAPHCHQVEGNRACYYP